MLPMNVAKSDEECVSQVQECHDMPSVKLDDEEDTKKIGNLLLL
jgi:hypothetical protein